jgi:hypothetical protein
MLSVLTNKRKNHKRSNQNKDRWSENSVLNTNSCWVAPTVLFLESIGMSSGGNSVMAVGILELKTMSFKGSVYSLD